MDETVRKGPQAARWMAVGRSQDPDARSAGRTAVRQALDGGPDPKLLILFSSRTYDLQTLVKEIRHCSGGIPLIGCTTAGEISGDGPGEDGVVVTAVGGTGFDIRTAAVSAVRGNEREAGNELATLLRPVGQPTGSGGDNPGVRTSAGNRIMLLLTDGINSGQQQIVRGIYSVLGATVPLVGGAAGDGLQVGRTHQVHGDEVFDDAIVAAMITSTGPIGLGIQHGWRPVGDAMLVTAAAGNRIDAIDDRPALDVYLERLNAPAECHTDQLAFSAFAITHPFGFVRRHGTAIRSPSMPDFAGRAILTIDEVPQGKLLWLMEGDIDTTLQAGDQACADAIAGLGEQPPIGLLVFDCVARRTLLDTEGIEQEVGRMARVAGDIPIAGFYTYGEIARTYGVNGFHNQTLVALALG